MVTVPIDLLLLLLLLLLLNHLDLGNLLLHQLLLQILLMLVALPLELQIARHHRITHNRAPVRTEALIERIHARSKLARDLLISSSSTRDQDNMKARQATNGYDEDANDNDEEHGNYDGYVGQLLFVQEHESDA